MIKQKLGNGASLLRRDYVLDYTIYDCCAELRLISEQDGVFYECEAVLEVGELAWRLKPKMIKVNCLSQALHIFRRTVRQLNRWSTY